MLSLTLPVKSVPAKTQQYIFFDVEAEAGAELRFEDLPLVLPIDFLQGTRARVLLPNTIEKGTYKAFVRNANGQRTPASLFDVHGTTSARVQDLTDSPRKDAPLDQRVLFLPCPSKERVDTQRILAGNDFGGDVPDEEQGRFGDVAGPTKGGRWAYQDDVKITTLEFRASGAEARAAGSGWFIRRKGGGVEYLHIRLDNSDTYVTFNEILQLKKGDVLILNTVGATLEMAASVTTQPLRAGTGRVG